MVHSEEGFTVDALDVLVLRFLLEAGCFRWTMGALHHPPKCVVNPVPSSQAKLQNLGHFQSILPGTRPELTMMRVGSVSPDYDTLPGSLKCGLLHFRNF